MKISEELADTFVLIDIGTDWASLFIVKNGQVALIRPLVVQPESAGRSVADDAFVQNVVQTVLASQLLDTSNLNYKLYLTGSESRIKTASPVLSSRLGGVEIDHFRQSSPAIYKI